MYGEVAAQRIMVIHDAGKEVPVRALIWALYGCSLKPGDTLVLLGVLHLGKKAKTITSAERKNLFGQSFSDIEVARKKQQFENSLEISQISMIYNTKKVRFLIDVASGSSPKSVAVEAAIRTRATWVILDRKMKKDKAYFLKNVSCGISKMTRHNDIVQLRGPQAKNFRNDSYRVEILPDIPDVEDDDLFSIELFPASKESCPFSRL